MRTASGVCRAGVVAIAMVLTIGVAGAAAQSVELSHEDVTHCGPLTLANHVPSGGCGVRVIGAQKAILVHHNGLMEVPFSSCDTEFEMRLNEDGHGYIYNQSYTQASACGREPCDEGEAGANPHRNLPWEAELTEPAGGVGQEKLTVTMCLAQTSADPGPEGQTGTPCVFDMAVTTSNHTLEFATARFDGSFGGGALCTNLPGTVEVQGHWVTAPNESHPLEIEVTHTP